MRQIYWYIESTQGYIRFFGYGIRWKNTRHHPLIFSERQGIKKYIRIGKWIITTITN